MPRAGAQRGVRRELAPPAPERPRVPAWLLVQAPHHAHAQRRACWHGHAPYMASPIKYLSVPHGTAAPPPASSASARGAPSAPAAAAETAAPAPAAEAALDRYVLMSASEMRKSVSLKS